MKSASPSPSPNPIDEARKRLDAAVEAFRRTAHRAVDVAANPKAARMEVDDARHQATFGLAAVGAALKGALKAARPGDPDA